MTSSSFGTTTSPPPKLCKNERSIEEDQCNVNHTSGNHTFEGHFIKWNADERNEYQFIKIYGYPEQLFLSRIDTTGSDVAYYALIYSNDGKEWSKIPNLINTKQIYGFESLLSARYLKFLPIAYIKNIFLQIDILRCPDRVCDDLIKPNCEEYCHLKKLYCNGTSCVRREDCPCIENGTIYKKGEEISLGNCTFRVCNDRIFKLDIRNISCANHKCDPEEEPTSENCTCTCKCKKGTIWCRRKKVCGGICDGKIDCTDGSDEKCCIPKSPPIQNCTIKEDVCEERNHTKCSFREKKIIPFSKKVFSCETCNGYLIKDRSENALFFVKFTRECEKRTIVCNLFTTIKHDDLLFQIGFDFAIYLVKGGPHYIEVSSSNSVIDEEKGYKILVVADTIQFISTKFGFTVTWRMKNIVDIEVSSCLLDRILGLCGYYTRNKIANENITENGTCADDPCEEWSEFTTCGRESYKLNQTLENISQKSCNSISKVINYECKVDLDLNKTFESFNAITQICPDTIYGSCSSISECNCEALKYFYGSRLCDRKTEFKLFQKYKCVICDTGLVWNSCGIDETCDTIKMKSEENKGKRVAGCFCPEGMVNIDNQCRPATECTAKCNVYGDPNYRTFDNKNFRFRGNCNGTYVLLQTKTNEIDDPDIKIFGVNARCNSLTNATCTVGVIVKYQESILEVYANKTVIFDNEIVTCNYKDAYCLLGEISFKEYTELNTYQMNITKHFVIVSYKLLNSGQHSLGSLTVEIPTILFYNKTEGLCGVYNDDDSDDFSLRNGVIVNNISTFVSDWIYGKKKDNCKIGMPEYCPSNITKCFFKSHENCSVVDTSGFFKRHVESCQADFACKSVTRSDLCKYKILYAEDCCQRHVKIGGWLQDERCNITCKENQTYRCVDICEIKCPIDRNDQCEKGRLTRMACACPDGYVEKDDKCIKKEECENCTAKPSLDIPAGHFNIDGCINEKPILNRRQCEGECNAVSSYGIDGYYEKNCNCCTPSAFLNFEIPLYCKKNDSTILFSIAEPIKCKCEPCHWHEQQLNVNLSNETSSNYNEL